MFTTHTPVPAGIDRFPRELVSQYFGGNSPTPGVPVDRILALGAEDYDGGEAGVFNMAVMGFRLAQRANGVSELHGHVSRGMFNGLWPAFDEAEVPITSITNGVHGPTWIAREVIELAASRGGDIDGDDTDALWPLVDQISDREIWDLKRTLRTRFVDDARDRMRRSATKRGYAAAETTWIDSALDPNVLTIGFARRVPTYKRLTLMLRDPARLKKLLLDPERPIQLVIAGKAHPADETGKRLIQEMVRFADDPEVRHRIAFLPNYDIAMAQPLYPGCDVWLNNPLRPYEACGTSGMKAALNGGLNLSILDGWWDEWYDGNNGWAIPSADGIEDPDRRDDLEANALYDLLESEVVPRFYEADDEGVPPRWLEMVRHTLKSLGPKVLATRQVRDYVRELYAPAAHTARTLNSDYVGARSPVGLEARRPRRVAGRPRRARRLRGRGRPGRRGRDARRPRLGGARLAVGRRRRGAGRPRADRLRRRPHRDLGDADAGGGVLRRQPPPLRRRRAARAVRPVRLHGPRRPAQRVAGLRRRARAGGRAGLTVRRPSSSQQVRRRQRQTSLHGR